MNNPRVANRMANYANFSAKMCVKFLINGNSFYYGRLMAYYVPLPNSDVASTIVAGVPAKSLGSQRLKLFIDPSESQAGIMKFPFIWPYDKVNLTSSTEYDTLGEINIIALNDLKHANGSTTPITITVYAWMEDVRLSAPTATNPTFISAQAGKDEYGDGIVSAPASALARMTGKLASTPIIGKYARATSVAAGAGAQIAKMFGMSRPTAIENATLMQPKYVGGFSVTDTADPAVKMTVDSKQELCVDTSVTGVETGDEMALNHLASIETYLTTYNWTVAYNPGQILFAARPSPQHYYRAGTPAYTTVPACAFVANAFKYWKGTMKYRFQVVSSGYHKGRLLVVWDPIKGTTTAEQNVTYSKVIDINEDRDFTIEIGWGQPRTWLECQELANPFYIVNGGTFTTVNNQYSNGVLTVYVLNELTTPNSAINNDIQVNVYVSMCDDASFAAPHERMATYSPYTGITVAPQSGTDLDVEDTNNIPIMDETTEKITECVPKSDSSDLVYMGEHISSFRQLIKRYALLNAVGNLGASAGYFSWSTSDFPIGRGYYLNGLRAGTTYNYNNVNTTMLRYMTFGFFLYRGGIRNKIVSIRTGTNDSNSLLVVNRLSTKTFSAPTLTTTTSTTVPLYEDQSLALVPTGLEGMHLTIIGQQPVLEVEYPYYAAYRFSTCRNAYAGGIYPSVDDITHKFVALSGPILTSYYTYVSGAEDSTFSLFQGCIPFQVSPTFS